MRSPLVWILLLVSTVALGAERGKPAKKSAKTGAKASPVSPPPIAPSPGMDPSSLSSPFDAPTPLVPPPAAPPPSKPKPEEPVKAAAPAKVEQYRSVSAFSDAQAKPAEQPAASSPVVPPGKSTKLDLSARAGAGFSSESYTPGTGQGVVGAALEYKLGSALYAIGQLDYRIYSQVYVTNQPAIGEPGTVRARLDERRFSALAAVGYDLGPALDKSAKLLLRLHGGFALSYLINAVAPGSVLAPDLGLELGFKLSEAVSFRAGYQVGFNLVSTKTLSAAGSPGSMMAWEAGLRFPLSSSFAVGIGYQGDSLSFEYDGRVAHGAVFQFHTFL